MRFWIGCLLPLLLAVAGCTSENPEYCDGDASCQNPASPVCHPTRHYCHAGCANDQNCRDPANRGFEPGKPICQTATRHCVAAAPDGGGRDAGADLLAGDGPRQANGTPCQSDDRCESGHCVDGVCCAGACDGTCVTCNAAGNLGSCVPVVAGEDPRKVCGGKHPKCAGSCDGKGSCSFAATLGLECEAATCSAGERTTSKCDASGACAASKQPCGGYACSTGGACKTSCTTTASDCTGSAQCVSGKCVDNLPLGSACGSNPDACQSKLCTDGVCCKIASCGACQSCGAGGDCLPVTDGKSCGPTSCTGDAASGAQKSVQACKTGVCASSSVSCGDYLCDATKTDCLAACTSDAQCKGTAYCDGSAKCVPKKPVGQPCGGAKECQNGICKDGYCCATACTGTCQRCDLAVKGQCANTPAGQDPDLECTGKVTACAGSCSGAGACSFPVGKSCQGPSCAGSTLTSYGCDATGGCTGAPSSCAPYTCAAAGTACRTTCAAAGECTTGYCDLLGSPDASRLNKCAASADLCKPAPGGPTIQSCLDLQRYYVLPADGSYGENLATKASVQLLSTGTVGPLLVGGAPAVGVAKVLLRPTLQSTPGLRIDHPTALHGFEISPNGGTGPLVYANHHALIRTSWIHHAAGAGIGRIPTGTYMAIQLDLVDVGITNCSEGISVKAVDLSLDRVGIGTSGGHGLVQIERTLKLRDVLIAWNLFGSGVYTVGAALDVDRAKIGANKKGMQLTASTTGTIWNTLVNDNAEEGILISGTSTPKLYSVTVANNNGVGLDCGTPGVQVANSIVWGKTDTTSKANDCVFSYSDVRLPGGAVAGGTGNLDQDPGFLGGTGTDPYSLQAGSVCLDLGADNLGLIYPTKDVIGNPRKVDKPGGGSLIDLGAYELQ